ncbi:SDR family NAD(P)-dependent oxidoreductase [Marinimicrobium sp. ABcell2]|uniref:SDR family NAD(P)-dependent oxidoreductase n=1 Tax=Marinimicrobium sp. ABcell2 TaxID=3069751 RepID=UPI0027AE3C30|nr:SDR family oxidoreductase [Marinimicrobium sp. ABcell2]MDQ2075808.1 SDR family oxidoreductase [Marinimicrobium sp. ABcell2]
MKLTNQYPSLQDKVVLITGGASGIGANLVEAFCCQMARVAFIDIRRAEAEALVARLEQLEHCSTPHFYHCDLVNVPALQTAIESVRRDLGNVTVLINNAADDTRHDFREVTVDYWDDRIAVNLRHHFFASQAVYGHMCKAGGGAIINLGSMSWYATQGGMPGYTSSKAAIEGLTRGLARDMGPDNIRVNTLVPGWVMTERQRRLCAAPEASQTILDSQCLKASVMPQDISAMALFLASDDSRMCTAQHYIVDGGWV